MAKSTKHQDKVGKLEDFRAPWETESGAEVDVDKPTLKRLLFNLKFGEAKALDTAEDSKAEVAEAQTKVDAANTERDEAKQAAASANPAEAQKTIEKLEKKVTDLTNERDGLVKANEHRDLRASVIGDLDPKYAKYVTGETEDDLKKSLEAVRADFGLEEPSEENENEAGVRTAPKPRSLRNGGDARQEDGGGQADYESAADLILSGGRVI